MDTRNSKETTVRKLAAVTAAALLVGCGGGGGRPAQDAERTVAFGPITTRVVGTSQPPVTSSGFGAVVTGVAGATFNSVTLHDKSGFLADSLIAFESNRDGAFGYYVMNADGTKPVRLTGTSLFREPAAFAPDGTKIAFVDTRDGNREIYIMNVDGSNQTRLTFNGAIDDQPSFSPDGSKIVFRSTRDGTSQIYVMNPNGSGQTRLTLDAAGNVQPVFAPDGGRIIFVSTRNGSNGIFMMNADGTTQFRLTSNTDGISSPTFSPDGAKIAFSLRPAGLNLSRIISMDANGLNQQVLTNTTFFDQTPTFSPDGSKIAFTSNRDGPGIGDFAIFVMNANGTNQVRVTNLGSDNSAPAWSPFLTRRVLVGTDALLGTEAAGFFFAQKGKGIPAVVTFDATTRSSTRVSARTPDSANGPNLVFEITAADSLTSLRYLTGPSPAATTVIGSSASVLGATNALVSFDAADGTVTSVLPYAANRGAPTPGDTIRNGGALVYRRKFLGVWDGAGRNLAPSGAHEVQIDARSGRLLSFK